MGRYISQLLLRSPKEKQSWRSDDFAVGLPCFCGALRDYHRVHAENVGVKIAAQRRETRVSETVPTLFLSSRHVVRTTFFVLLSSCNSVSFALCAFGVDRSTRIRLAGAHVGDHFVHHHHHAQWSLSKSEEVRLKLELQLHFQNSRSTDSGCASAVSGKQTPSNTGLRASGGNAPTVFAYYMSTMSISIDPLLLLSFCRDCSFAACQTTTS